VRMEERQHYEEECRRREKEVGRQNHNSSLKAVHTTRPASGTCTMLSRSTASSHPRWIACRF
jgi:hypothetical protein